MDQKESEGSRSSGGSGNSGGRKNVPLSHSVNNSFNMIINYCDSSLIIIQYSISNMLHDSIVFSEKQIEREISRYSS